MAVGGDVTEVRVGDHVAIDPSLYCHECHYCRRGRGNLCERWGAIGVTTVLHSFERAAELFAEGALRPDVMISHRMGLEDYPAALEQFRQGVGRKIQVLPHK